MRYFLSGDTPPFERLLLIESGSRHLIEGLLPSLYQTHGEQLQIDLVTCYAGTPAGLHEGAHIYRVSDYHGPEGRARLFAELQKQNYNITGVLCSAEPIMTKWKWAISYKVPAKLFIINENGDYFWFDRRQWRTIRHFALYRAGLSGAGAVRTIARLIFFPFGVLFLILYAAVVHLKRKVSV